MPSGYPLCDREVNRNLAVSLGDAHHKTSLIDIRCCYAKAEAGALSLVGLAKTAVNIRLQLRVLG